MDHCRHMVSFWRGLDLDKVHSDDLYCWCRCTNLSHSKERQRKSLCTWRDNSNYVKSTNLLLEHTDSYRRFVAIFPVLTLFCLKSEKQNRWFIAGVAIGLTFASRYPIFLPAIVLFIAESVARKNTKLISCAIVTLVPVMVLIVSAVYVKTGGLTLQ
jgi:hypothetical protein